MAFEIQTILVGYDGFKRKEALPPWRRSLAKEHGAKLHLLHVAPEPPRQSWWSKDPESQKAYHEDVAGRLARLEELLATARKNGIEATAVVRSGSPHVEIIQEAVAIKADLVMVTDEFIDWKGERGFGAVTMKLIRYCPIPVLAKRDPRRFRHRSIVASLDLETELEESTLNASILDMAAALARNSDASITVFNTWTLWGEHLLTQRGRMRPEAVRALLDETKHSREAEAKRLLAAPSLAGIEVGVEVQKGEPRDLLPAFVEKNKIDIVVMGTVGRSGLKGAIMGNTAEQILNDLSCSVWPLSLHGFARRLPIGRTSTRDRKSVPGCLASGVSRHG